MHLRVIRGFLGCHHLCEPARTLRNLYSAYCRLYAYIWVTAQFQGASGWFKLSYKKQKRDWGLHKKERAATFSFSVGVIHSPSFANCYKKKNRCISEVSARWEFGFCMRPFLTVSLLSMFPRFRTSVSTWSVDATFIGSGVFGLFLLWQTKSIYFSSTVFQHGFRGVQSCFKMSSWKIYCCILVYFRCSY